MVAVASPDYTILCVANDGPKARARDRWCDVIIKAIYCSEHPVLATAPVHTHKSSYRGAKGPKRVLWVR